MNRPTLDRGRAVCYVLVIFDSPSAQLMVYDGETRRSMNALSIVAGVVIALLILFRLSHAWRLWVPFFAGIAAMVGSASLGASAAANRRAGADSVQAA